MQITNNTVVTIDFTLTNDEGEVLDTSEGHDPMPYLHGAGEIIPGLERALEGKSVGDHLLAKVGPADSYGDYNQELVYKVERSMFEESATNLELGQQYEIELDEGTLSVIAVEIDEEHVTVDGNHPLTGIDLNFDITVREVREATAEEIAHGHAHGAGGCEG